MSLLQHIPALIIEEYNASLNIISTLEEVQRIIFDFSEDNSSSPNGFSSHLF